MPLNEDQIIEGLERRDPASVAALYDRYGQIVYSAVYRILEDKLEAEDIVQEMFLQVWTRGRLIKDRCEDGLGPWLLKLACRLAIDHLKAVRKGHFFYRTSSQLAPAPVHKSWHNDGFRAAFKDLTHEQVIAIELVYLEAVYQTQILGQEEEERPLAGKTWARAASSIFPLDFSRDPAHRLGTLYRGALATALIAIVSIAGLTFKLHNRGVELRASSRSPALGLNASFQPNGALHLNWLPNNPDLHGQIRAVLQISDGLKRIPIALDGTAWRAGSFDYQGQTNDVDVRLTVSTGDRNVWVESVRVASSSLPSTVLQAARAGADPIPPIDPIHHSKDRLPTRDPKMIRIPDFVLAAKPLQQLAPPPVVVTWELPPVEELAPPVRSDMIASSGAKLGIPTFPESAP